MAITNISKEKSKKLEKEALETMNKEARDNYFDKYVKLLLRRK